MCIIIIIIIFYLYFSNISLEVDAANEEFWHVQREFSF